MTRVRSTNGSTLAWSSMESAPRRRAAALTAGRPVLHGPGDHRLRVPHVALRAHPRRGGPAGSRASRVRGDARGGSGNDGEHRGSFEGPMRAVGTPAAVARLVLLES